MTIFERFKAVVFDMDGVLVNSSPIHARAYENLWSWLEEQGVSVNAPRYADIAGRGTTQVLNELLLGQDQSLIRQAIEFKQNNAYVQLAEGSLLYPDVVPLVSQLTAANMPIAIGTSASKRGSELVASSIMAKLGLDDSLFKAVISAEHVASAKPAPDIFLAAIAACGVDPKDTLIIEDSFSGATAALAANANVAVVRTQDFAFDNPRYLGYFPDLNALVGAH